MHRARPAVPRGSAPALRNWRSFSVLAQIWYDGHMSSNGGHGLVGWACHALYLPPRGRQVRQYIAMRKVVHLVLKHMLRVGEWVYSLSQCAQPGRRAIGGPGIYALWRTNWGCLGPGWQSSLGSARGSPIQNSLVGGGCIPTRVTPGKSKDPWRWQWSHNQWREVYPRWERGWRYGKHAQWPNSPLHLLQMLADSSAFSWPGWG